MTREQIDGMTVKEKRNAIAIACGWECRYGAWYAPGNIAGGGVYAPPDYLNNLNAMLEACKNINLLAFLYHLQKVTGLQSNAAMDVAKLLHATAAQRADAFLLTIDSPALATTGAAKL